MKYTQKRNTKLMVLMILSVWIVSALISIPPLFGWGRASKTLQKHGICLVSQDFRYQIYATLLAFYIPLLVMIIIYINIYRTAKKIKEKELKTCGRLKDSNFVIPIKNDCSITAKNQSLLGHQKFEQNFQKCKTATTYSQLLTSFNFTSNGTPMVTIDTKKKHFLNKFFQSKTKHSESISETSNRSIDSKIYSSSSSSQDGNANINSNANLSNNTSNVVRQSNLKIRLSRRLTSVFSGIKRHSNSSGSQGKNQKATQTLGIIMGCFILCWLPFFMLAVVKPIPLKNGKTVKEYIPPWLDSLLLWLGYFNSALNPIIYALFNREFRRPFIEILCLRCFGINEKLRDEERKKIYTNTLNNITPRDTASNSYNNFHNKISNKSNIALNNYSHEHLTILNGKDEKRNYDSFNSKEMEMELFRQNINILNYQNDENFISGDEIMIKKNINTNNDIKNYKLNELVSSRFYNLTIIDGIKVSFDKPFLSLKIKASKKKHIKYKKKDIKKNNEENLEYSELNKTAITRKVIHTAEPETEYSKLLLKQKSLDDNKHKVKIKTIKQSSSVDEFKTNIKNSAIIISGKRYKL